MSFYVYFHKIPDTDIVFYVGKGRGYRARDRNGRNHLWRETVKRYGGFDVEIVSDNLQEWYAVELEADYILKYELKSEGGSLCNLIYEDISKHGRIFSKQELKRLSESSKVLTIQGPILTHTRLLMQLQKKGLLEQDVILKKSMDLE